MYIERLIDKELLAWKNASTHKPLLLRGARQVGKSSSVRHLATFFDYFIEVNLERNEELKSLFTSNTNVREIANQLSGLYGVPVVPGKTLVFIDEIQVCENAIKSLWFFKEDYPELHVIAAGSLLEFALKNIRSFGVGRIRSMFMYPLSFDEFLLAEGKKTWVDCKRNADSDHPLFDTMHKGLVDEFRKYLIVGGMPACIVQWLSTNDYLACAAEQEDIHQTYYDDFVKYSERIDPQLLRNTLHSVVVQTGSKFVYSGVEGGYRTDDIKRALTMLCDAGLIKEVMHTAANGAPLGAEGNPKFKKYIFLDSGLLLRICDLYLGGAKEQMNVIMLGTAADLVNKGGLTEMVAGWELIKYSSPRVRHELYYWENLERGTTSEVDYILMNEGKVMPIEVKSGVSGKMKSLRLFMQKKNITNAIRASLENFGKLTVKDEANDEERQISILPLYAISNLQH